MHNVVNRQRMMLDIMIYVYLFVCSHFFRNLNKQNKGVYSFPELNFPLAYVVFIECFFSPRSTLTVTLIIICSLTRKYSNYATLLVNNK